MKCNFLKSWKKIASAEVSVRASLLLFMSVFVIADCWAEQR